MWLSWKSRRGEAEPGTEELMFRGVQDFGGADLLFGFGFLGCEAVYLPGVKFGGAPSVADWLRPGGAECKILGVSGFWEPEQAKGRRDARRGPS